MFPWPKRVTKTIAKRKLHANFSEQFLRKRRAVATASNGRVQSWRALNVGLPKVFTQPARTKNPPRGHGFFSTPEIHDETTKLHHDRQHVAAN